ncbi:MAG: threonine--tRNA ligase [Deltaproteobacteria bacterium]|nr:threonine--tRNA ligase [Deltaproteobacteria bacterium]
MQIQFEGNPVELTEKTTGIDLVKKLNLPKSVIALKVGERLSDLRTPVPENSEIKPIYIDSPEGLEILRHSTAHIMADAVKRIFGNNVKITIGPSIEDGFYYDFDTERPFEPSDLEKIEAEMKKIIKEDLPFIREEVSYEKAKEIFSQRGEDYKLELLEELKGAVITLYKHGNFIDLCRGPHLPSTGYVKAFKLLSIAGAYWRGDERNKMLQRIYGTAFPTKEALEEYLNRLEEAKRRDHRRLGVALDLYSTTEEVGGGLIIWHPRGGFVRTQIENYWREQHLKRGYSIVYSPHIGRADLWKISGHLEFYKENMYSPMEIDNFEYYVKPMNCPFHIQIYKSKTRSYKDLPLRYAELGTVYRYERSGVLHGLLRVRGFTQDDAHIFCTPEQLKDEVMGVVQFAVDLFKTFGFNKYEAYLATRPDKAVGDPAKWEEATNSLREAADRMNIKLNIEEKGGAFYGPKIDLKIKDSLGREWQCTTVQFDFNLPERFDISYIGYDNQKHRPYTVHRALLGSMERFFGILIEHYAGAFPVWLSPEQVVILPVSEKYNEYAKSLNSMLIEKGFRSIIDLRNEKLSYKIREAELLKVPFMIIVGEKEATSQTVSVRTRGMEDLGSMTIEEFIEKLSDAARIPICQ